MDDQEALYGLSFVGRSDSDAKLLETDLALHGRCMTKLRADGKLVRIAPEEYMIGLKPLEQRDEN